MDKTFGLPLVCPKCPSKHYFGLLKGETLLRSAVRPNKADVCPNCGSLLIDPAKPRRSR